MKKNDILEGKYQILSVLGEGGTGRVYKARHLLLHKIRAIKEIRRADHENVEIIWEHARREIDILRKLDHPGIPGIIDVMARPDALYIVMEYIEGKSLGKILETRGCLTPAQGLEISLGLVDLLAWLHSRRPAVVHGDLKPSNIMIRKDGSPVLIDFGSAIEAAEGQKKHPGTGTRGYAAPEQILPGGRIGEEADIYSFGVTLAVMLTGLDPARTGIFERPLHRWNPDISPALEALIAKCTKSKPEERYADCGELRDDLIFLHSNYRERIAVEWKKTIFFILLFLSGIAGLASSFAFRAAAIHARQDLIGEYMSRASVESSLQNAAGYYEKALKAGPAQKEIYQGITEKFIIPGHFSPEEAGLLIKTLYTPVRGDSAWKRYRREAGKDYVRTCYEIGIGFFYEMGGPVGKKESGVWFKEVVRAKKNQVEPDIHKRAECYRKISRYYERFDTGGLDKSGENKDNFEEFFRTLHKLNQIRISKKDGPAEAAVAYMISKEILMEIGYYGQEFLSRETISRRMLAAEIENIKKEDGRSNPRWILMEKYRSKEEMDELAMLLSDTRGKLNNISE